MSGQLPVVVGLDEGFHFFRHHILDLISPACFIGFSRYGHELRDWAMRAPYLTGFVDPEQANIQEQGDGQPIFQYAVTNTIWKRGASVCRRLKPDGPSGRRLDYQPGKDLYD